MPGDPDIFLAHRERLTGGDPDLLLEESPSAAISDELRKKMGETAVRAAKAVGYENAGTIEFLLDKQPYRHGLRVRPEDECL